MQLRPAGQAAAAGASGARGGRDGEERLELQGQEVGARHQRLGSQAQDAMNQGRGTSPAQRWSAGRCSRVRWQDSGTSTRPCSSRWRSSSERESRLAEQVAAFRIEKETIKATYTASEAQVRANEAVAGVGSYLTEVGTSLDRARDRVAQMQARAAATDELLSSGALQDLSAAPDADIERQLAASAKADVERQLEAMRREKQGGAAFRRDRKRTGRVAQHRAGSGRVLSHRFSDRRPGRERQPGAAEGRPLNGSPSTAASVRARADANTSSSSRGVPSGPDSGMRQFGYSFSVPG